ncbi:MAG: aldo/keto reductase [Kiritimatiellae bacterium]|nr:aldo/keto reductase [Kiritimatiellia bacterium]
MEKRFLGKTGVELSVIGFGGIVVCDVSPQEASSSVARAIDKGINYFDVAPSYGNAEERLGPALEPFRDQVFLACKTGKRTAEEAKIELNNSLKTLRTDHFDLYQFHGVSSVEQAEQILEPGGALETFMDARDHGLINHIGFSAHSEEAALLLLNSFQFDSMLLPVNRFCWQDGGFGQLACASAQEKGTGILALKSLAKRPCRKGEKKKWNKCWYVPVDTLPEAMASLKFTLSKHVTAAVCPSHAELLWLACDALDALNEDSSMAIDLAEGGEPIFTTQC